MNSIVNQLKVKRKRNSRNKFEVNLDLVSLKKKFLNEEMIKEESKDFKGIIDYDKAAKEYSKTGFTSNVINFLNRMINDSTAITSEIRANHPIQKYVVHITNLLLLNENEITYLSLYLDRFGWKSDGFTVFEHILVLGCLTKIYLNDEVIYGTILDYISEDYEISKMIDLWLQGRVMSDWELTVRDVNAKYRELSKSASPYCRKDYLDYNFIVDKILEMSLSYSEYNKEGGKNEKEKNILNTRKPITNSELLITERKSSRARAKELNNVLRNNSKSVSNFSVGKLPNPNEVFTEAGFLIKNKTLTKKHKEKQNELPAAYNPFNTTDSFFDYLGKNYNERETPDIFANLECFKQCSNPDLDQTIGLMRNESNYSISGKLGNKKGKNKQNGNVIADIEPKSEGLNFNLLSALKKAPTKSAFSPFQTEDFLVKKQSDNNFNDIMFTDSIFKKTSSVVGLEKKKSKRS